MSCQLAFLVATKDTGTENKGRQLVIQRTYACPNKWNNTWWIRNLQPKEGRSVPRKLQQKNQTMVPHLLNQEKGNSDGRVENQNMSGLGRFWQNIHGGLEPGNLSLSGPNRVFFLWKLIRSCGIHENRVWNKFSTEIRSSPSIHTKGSLPINRFIYPIVETHRSQACPTHQPFPVQHIDL